MTGIPSGLTDFDKIICTVSGLDVQPCPSVRRTAVFKVKPQMAGPDSMRLLDLRKNKQTMIWEEVCGFFRCALAPGCYK